MESDLWTTMRRELGPLGDLQRIENIARNGMPDVNGCIRGREFWVELKWLHAWPRRETDVVKFPKYRREQRIWIRRRCLDHGARNVFILLRVEIPRQLILFDWEAAIYKVGLVTRAELFRVSLLWEGQQFPTGTLVSMLRREVGACAKASS